MALNEYRRKRDFGKTTEPEGKREPLKKSKGTRAFVVQKHRASRLHYDFRLEHDGVLLSWAVPKGPSYDPAVKRLAMHVEDHPLDYASFEGVIPENEYGGGTVMVWDQGAWEPESPDVDKALARGDLKMKLDGQKLKGSWVLVRTKGRDKNGGDRTWLLIKHRDEYATTGDVTEAFPRSVTTGRLLAEIAYEEGGDVEKAASADPRAEIERLIANPERAHGSKKKAPAVWRSHAKNPKKTG